MPIPPVDFFLECSVKSLQDLELVSLSHSANLSRGLRETLEMWVEREATAMLARWMIEHREELLHVRAAPKSVDFLSSGAKKTA